MSKPRGHSNMVGEAEPISTSQAMIPIHGGATVTTYRALPSLIVTHEEWRMIGERMGWASDRRRRVRPPATSTNEGKR